MKTFTIEISVILLHLISVYCIFNTLTLIFNDIKITLSNLFNPFREYSKKYLGAHIFLFVLSVLIWILLYGFYIDIILKNNFIITW